LQLPNRFPDYCIHLADAPHVLIVVGNKDAAWKRQDGYNSLETDLAIAMHHMTMQKQTSMAEDWPLKAPNVRPQQSASIHLAKPDVLDRNFLCFLLIE
jgi:hypothetical protein